MRKTKIVATLGPATDRPDVLRSLIDAGMDVARFNFSHGTHEETEKRVQLLREACEDTKSIVAFLGDTKGPEVRLGLFESGEAYLTDGELFTLTTGPVTGDKNRVTISYKNLAEDVNPGNRILLDDGLIELAVESIAGTDIITRVVHGGPISDRKGVNLPGVRLNMPFLSDEDLSDLRFIVEMGFDFVAASFVRSKEDIDQLREQLSLMGGESVKIIAKIENAEGIQNIDAILAAADGLMVARGDLGVEIASEELPILQKSFIKKAYQNGKDVITATQMLESMISHSRPTRAEISDVANAIYDGTGAVMLSGETAVGKYPVEALTMMAKIALRTEREIHYITRFQTNSYNPQPSVTNAISRATVTIAHEFETTAILTISKSGITARNVSKFRPSSPIICCTPDPMTRRQLKMTWGVIPLLTIDAADTSEMFNHAIETAEKAGYISVGELVVITAGTPIGRSGTTNMLKVYRVGDKAPVL